MTKTFFTLKMKCKKNGTNFLHFNSNYIKTENFLTTLVLNFSFLKGKKKLRTKAIVFCFLSLYLLLM